MKPICLLSNFGSVVRRKRPYIVDA